MGVRFGVIVLFFLGLTCSSHARNPILLESPHENQVCELCDKYVTLAIDYLQDDDNHNALVEVLHISCSQIPPLKKTGLSILVDVNRSRKMTSSRELAMKSGNFNETSIKLQMKLLHQSGIGEESYMPTCADKENLLKQVISLKQYYNMKA